MAAQTPSPDEVSKSHRWFAIEMTNLAWDLAEKPARSPAEEETMIHAAHAAAIHWTQAGGTGLHSARADMLLGQVHALAGNGPQAMFHTQRSHAYFSTRETNDWELAFAHAVLANAGRSAGASATYVEHYRLAKVLGAAIANHEDKEIFERTSDQIPDPTP
jgi:hypothetical protein